MWHSGLEVVNEMTMKINVLRDVTIFCLVDICYRHSTTGWFYLLFIREAKLCHKVRNGGLIWGISTFQNKKRLVTSQNKDSVKYNVKLYIKLIIFLNSLFLFFSRHVNGTISLISAPQYIVYWKRAYYILMSISENISLLIKLQNGEQNWTKSSLRFYRFHYYL
jgi:hypothetical protein